MNRHLTTMGGCVSVLLCLSVTLLAQRQSTSKKAIDIVAADSVRRSSKPMDVITVVATRSEQPMLNVPLAITVIPAVAFRNNRGIGLDEALSVVPGVLVQSRSGNQDVRVSIRGFGARGAGERSNAGTTRGLRFLLDGLPLTEPDGRTSLDLVDLTSTTSIEVIRSNTSALWGNASGGVVSISTLPDTTSTSAEIQNTLGSFGFSKQNIRAATHFSSSTLYCSVSNTNNDGWREHSGSTSFQALVGLRSLLAPRTTLGITAMAASNLLRIPGPLTLSQFTSNPRQAQSDTTVYNPGYTQRDERRFNRLGRIGVTLDHALTTEHSISCAMYAEPKYLQRSERNTFRDFNRYHVGGNVVYHYTADWSEQLHSQLHIGIDEQYQDGAILFYNLDPITRGRGTTLRDNKREGAQNLGMFIQEQLSIADKLTILVGARLDNISYYSYSYITPKLNDERTFSQWSPKLGLSYLIQPTVSVYTTFSRGVEVPAGNETDPPSALGEDTIRTINSALKPILSQTLECGLKHLWKPESSILRSLNYELSVYHVTTTNDLVPYRGGRFYMPAATTTRSGVEVGASAEFDEGFRLTVAASISKNTLNDYQIDSVYVNSALIGHTLDLSNNAMPGVPGHFVSARLRYTPTYFRQLFIETEWRMVGSYSVNDVHTVTADAYSVTDVLAGFQQDIIGGLSCRLLARVNNLWDTGYIASVWINPDLALVDKSPVYIEPGLARNVSFTVGLRYSWN